MESSDIAQGGTIAFIVAANDPSVAFIVSLAGAAIKGDSLMLRQVELISKSQGMPDALWQGTKPSLRNRYAILQQADKTTDELQKGTVCRRYQNHVVRTTERLEYRTADFRPDTFDDPRPSIFIL